MVVVFVPSRAEVLAAEDGDSPCRPDGRRGDDGRNAAAGGEAVKVIAGGHEREPAGGELRAAYAAAARPCDGEGEDRERRAADRDGKSDVHHAGCGMLSVKLPIGIGSARPLASAMVCQRVASP